MNRGYPQFTRNAQQGERGVDIASRIFNETYGWLFKRNHQEHDFGIDAQVEIVTEEGFVTGQMIAVQIKHGKSFFKEKNQWGYIFRGENKHFNYLSNYPIPVLIVLIHPETGECYWVKFEPEKSQSTRKGWKITVPFENHLSSSKSGIERLLPPVKDNLSDLQDYWAVNDLVFDSSYIHFIIDSAEVKNMDTTRPREFFDRLRLTKLVLP